MDWLIELFRSGGASHSVAHSIIALTCVAAGGLLLGSIRFFGIGLGAAGVLFVGIILAHLGLTLDHGVLEFVREFGLILFVYAVGLQVGPGFIASLRKQGLRLNLIATGIVLTGCLITIAIFKFGDVPLPAAVGLFSGATTNTPSLAAAQQAIRDTMSIDEATLAATGYAIAYPFGVIGIILAMLALRRIFKINVEEEVNTYLRSEEQKRPKLTSTNLEVTNANLEGCELSNLPVLCEGNVVISRVMHGGQVAVASPATKLHVGDTVLAVGADAQVERLRLVIGQKSDADLMKVKSKVTVRALVVTKSEVIGQSLDELNLTGRFGVTITRITRSEIELPVNSLVRLQFSDIVLAVGEAGDLDRVSRMLGNSPKMLQHPALIPVFVGILLGVIAGSIPFKFPGVPVPVKLGLAGGPLLVAIILSRVGRVGSLVWYLPASANYMIREMGIALFLACVGIRAGGTFFQTVASGDGLKWMGCAALITFIPIFLAGLLMRLKFRENYLPICGVMSGSMTDPPALAFATGLTGSEGPAIAYASVYPMTMFLRVLTAQLMVLLLL